MKMIERSDEEVTTINTENFLDLIDDYNDSPLDHQSELLKFCKDFRGDESDTCPPFYWEAIHVAASCGERIYWPNFILSVGVIKNT